MAQDRGRILQWHTVIFEGSPHGMTQAVEVFIYRTMGAKPLTPQVAVTVLTMR